MSDLREQLKQSVVIGETANVNAPVAVSEGGAILSIIERAARDPNVNIDKMERLFDMHQKMQVREAETAFNAAMATAQAQLEPVRRQTSNSHTGKAYADLATIAEAAQPIISAHGFGISFGTAPATLPDHIRMVCDLTHKGGFTKRYESEFPYDLAGSGGKVNKTRIQAFGSTTTYGRRYMTMLVFNIATEDNDGNAPKGPRKSSAESKRDGTDKRFNELISMIRAAISVDDLREFTREHQDEINGLPERWAHLVSDEWDLKRDELKAGQ
jgi:ERF superfamily